MTKIFPFLLLGGLAYLLLSSSSGPAVPPGAVIGPGGLTMPSPSAHPWGSGYVDANGVIWG